MERRKQRQNRYRFHESKCRSSERAPVGKAADPKVFNSPIRTKPAQELMKSSKKQKDSTPTEVVRLKS